MNGDAKRLVAAFFVPHRGELRTVEELLATAGARDITPNAADPSGLVDCTWAGMAAKGYLDELPYHHVLQIYFWQSSFLEMLDPDGGDAGRRLVDAFRDSCEQLAPDVAFVITHLDQAQRERILEREWMVLSADANALADERFGLLYLSPEVSDNWTQDPVRDDRDVLPAARGRLVHAGYGDARWF